VPSADSVGDGFADCDWDASVEGVGDQVVIVLLRPLAFDVLVHLGMPTDDARALLPPL
jgi:hypothetical protein